MRAGLLALLLVAAATESRPAEPDRVFAHPATAAELAALTRAPAASLAKAQVVRGRFVQRRHLAGLAQPLESSGTFLFARGVGIEWHTEQPFDSQFVLTDAGITQRDEGGEPLRIPPRTSRRSRWCRACSSRCSRSTSSRCRMISRYRACRGRRRLGDRAQAARRGAGQRVPPGRGERRRVGPARSRSKTATATARRSNCRTSCTTRGA